MIILVDLEEECFKVHSVQKVGVSVERGDQTVQRVPLHFEEAVLVSKLFILNLQPLLDDTYLGENMLISGLIGGGRIRISGQVGVRIV